MNEDRWAANLVCCRCGLGAEPATMYCGTCWYFVESIRDALGYVFDRDGEWDSDVRVSTTEGA